MSHKHPLNTFTPDFKINAVTREVIQVQPDVLITLMQYDHNSESLRFECPRFIDGHDMSLCNKVEVHFVNSDVAASVSRGGYYTVTDIAVNSSDPSLVNFSWVVSRNSTENVGTLVFSVRFICTTDDVIDYVWHTLPFTYVSVDQGLVNELDPEYQKIYLDNLETEAGKIVVEAAEAKTTALEAAERASEAINDLYSMDVTDKAPAIVCEASGEVISITDSANMPLKGLRLFGKSTQDGTPTPDAPVEIVSVEDPVVSICGKNLISCKDVSLEIESYYYHTIMTAFEPIIGETYTLSMDITCSVLPFHINIGCGATSYNSDMSPKVSSVYSENGRISITFEWNLTEEQIAAGYTKLAFRVPRFASETTFTATISNIMLEWGSEVTKYESYKSMQNLYASVTLHGIPVTSGGNYTDNNGQQWICDEVDLERGVYIQRVGTMTFTGEESWTKNQYYENTVQRSRGGLVSGSAVVCNMYAGKVLTENHGLTIGGALNVRDNIHAVDVETWKNHLRELYSNGTPVVVLGVLTTFIETPLTETEIAAYKVLHTNKPNTIILNDSGAWQSVDYVADTKLYIDNKFAELAKR